MRKSEVQDLLEGYRKNFRIATGMELQVSYTTGMTIEMSKLRDMIMEITGADPAKRCRQLKTIYSRVMFCIIAREMKYTLPEIGRQLKMDHTSIMHNLKSKKQYEEQFQEQLQKVRDWLMSLDKEN